MSVTNSVNDTIGNGHLKDINAYDLYCYIMNDNDNKPISKEQYYNSYFKGKDIVTKQNSPSKNNKPEPSYELFLKYENNDKINTFERLNLSTTKQIYDALLKININPNKLINNEELNNRKHKNTLFMALYNAYKKMDPTKNIETLEEDEYFSSEENDNDNESESDNETSDKIKNYKQELNEKEIKELRKICKEKSINIDKSMNKEDLINAIIQFEI